MPTAAGPAFIRPAPVTAGISASLTGQFATQGRQALAGLAAWVEYVNGPGGGILLDGRRRPVALRHYDDGSRAAAARRNTERLLDDDAVDLLFGPYSAGLTTAAAEVAAARARLLWNHGGAGDAVYDLRAGGVVGILAPAHRYLAGLPALARSAHPDAGALAIARVDAGAFARQVSHGAATAARALGFGAILHLTYPPDTADFAGIAAQIAAAAPDVLVAVGRIRHDIALARALTAPGSRPAIGLAAVVATPIADFAAALGAAAHGFVGPTQWEPQLAVPVPDFGPPPDVAMSLLRRAAAVPSVPVDYPAAQAFAAGLVAQRCLTDAGSADAAALYAAASAADFTTFYGRFRIDCAGRQVGRSVALVQRQRGRKAVIWPPEQADGRLQWPFRPQDS